MTDDLIIGAGGGGGKGGGTAAPARASIAADNLESNQIARFIDLLSEGEIEGFPSARAYARDSAEYNRALLKDVYLNNTPIVREGANPAAEYQAADFNFRDVTIVPRYGTQNQTYLPIGTSTQREKSVNVQVLNSTPVTRSITDENVNAVRVTISIPSLQIFKTNGDVAGNQVTIAIQFSFNGGPFTTALTDTIRGRTADLYTRTYRIDFTQPPPVDVRVVRITGDSAVDSDGGQLNYNTFWQSYTELIYAKTKYPNSALVGIKIDAEQFSSIPSRSYLIRGVKVAIPSNATVDSTNGRLIYSGVWNGTFAAAQWCSDPAWILWDILTSTRYGFGDHIQAAQLDKWAFYAASQYASALVPDGLGGSEPRFSCNVNIQTAEDAYKLINDLASTMRAMPYWGVGAFALTQDRPADASYVFNQANVTEEGFSYSGSSLKTRSTVAIVSYLDLETRDIAYEVVEDAAGIEKFGVLKSEISAFACTSRTQARRLGEWLLFEQQHTTEVISFNTGIDAGSVLRPGMVIKVADPVRAGRFRAGRVLSGTTTQVVLDRSAEQMFSDGMPASITFNVVLSDGTYQGIDGCTLNGSTLTLPTPLRLAPTPGAPYGLGIPSLAMALWRVISVQEQDGDLYGITGVPYDPSKYDYIERDVPLVPRDVSDLNVAPSTPANLQASEALYESNGQVLSKLIVSWQAVPNAVRYELRYRLGSGNWITVATRAPDYEILNSDVGLYEFELSALNAGLKRSGISVSSYAALGKTAPPATIPDLFIAPIDDRSAELYWPQAVDLDVRVGGSIRIRHTPEIGVNATWGRANDIVPAVAGSSTRKIVPLLEGTYFIRAVDSLGNESDGVASVVVDLPAPQDALLVQQYREDDDSPPFGGVKTNMVYSTDEAGLILSGAGLVDDIPSWDAIGLVDYYGGATAAGSYQFISTLDLGATYDINLRAILQTRAFEPGNTWDERLGIIDEWDDIDGDDLSAVNASLSVRTTTNNPSGAPTWGSWQPFVNGTTRGRGLQFKMDATTTNPAQNIIVEQLGVITEFQRRTETQRNLASGTGSYAVTFPSAFYATPSIGITAQDMGQGDYFVLSSITRTGFQVTFRNSGGSIVSRTFDYQAVGHGREIT